MASRRYSREQQLLLEQRRACPMWDDETFRAHYTLALGFAGGCPAAAQEIVSKLYAGAVEEAAALTASLAAQTTRGQLERAELDRIYTRLRFPGPCDMALAEPGHTQPMPPSEL
ncbi:hypothetical protein IWQ56_006053 [Coemansia nantahalensis]|nr:hypothetical protein IWQ56_006053 [Coemansia nantahalensis]